MPVTRTEINAETVRTARALAAAKAPGVNIFTDTRDRYLQIRQRGGAADWLVKPADAPR
jgi:hypothetical protein